MRLSPRVAVPVLVAFALVGPTLPVDRQIVELAVGFSDQSLKGGRVVALNHGWHDTPASKGPRPKWSFFQP